MKTQIKPRRSVLYMPGSNTRATEKARSLPADCVILDLEDAVAPDAKDSARSQAAAAIRAGGYGYREVALRINGNDTEWFAADIAAAATCGADAVLMPKVESAAEVRAVALALDKAGGNPELPLWIMTETPRGVLELESILAEQPRIGAVVMGTTDLAKELRVVAGEPRGLAHSRGHCVLAARAQGVDIIDGVHLKLDDPDGFRQACENGRAMGFDGKSLIHPRQIDAANEVFGVAADGLAHAQALVAAWQEAEQQGQGVAVLNGRLVEKMHVDEAHRVLALHEATQRN